MSALAHSFSAACSHASHAITPSGALPASLTRRTKFCGRPVSARAGGAGLQCGLRLLGTPVAAGQQQRAALQLRTKGGDVILARVCQGESAVRVLQRLRRLPGAAESLRKLHEGCRRRVALGGQASAQQLQQALRLRRQRARRG